METDTKTEGAADTQNKGTEEGTSETISIPKKDYDVLNQTLGSLKKENKDFKKKFDEFSRSSETKETSKNQPDEISILKEKLEKQALRSSGLTHTEDIELARNLAKKWNMDVDDVLGDEDFQAKLERQRTNRANVEATSGVKGSGARGSAKESTEYWLAKGTPPTPADVPDNTTRRKIVREMLKASKGKKLKFYND